MSQSTARRTPKEMKAVRQKKQKAPQVINEDEKGTGATVVRVLRTPLGKMWSIDNVEKFLMSKGVGLLL